MDDLEKLSDRQLRQRMLQYSPLNIPVTPTTRQVVIKKLREHMSTKTANLKNNTQHQHNKQLYSLEPSVKPHDILYRQYARSNSMPSKAIPVPPVENNNSKHTFIPCLLITALMLLFFVGICVYMSLNPELFHTINEKYTGYTLCDAQHKDPALSLPSYSCIEKDKLEPALLVLKHLLPELQKRAEQHFCLNSKQDASMTTRELMQYLHRLGLVSDMRETLKDLHNAEYLIDNNPQWKIRHVLPGTNEILQFDEVIQLRAIQGNAFALVNPRLPFACAFPKKMNEFFGTIGSATIVCAASFVLFTGYRFIQSSKNAHVYAVQSYTKIILTELMRKAAFPDSSPPVVVVSHLRDKVIPPDKRKNKVRAWNEAVRNLEQNDNRIQFNVARCNGQLCKTMKWIAHVPDIYM